MYSHQVHSSLSPFQVPTPAIVSRPPTPPASIYTTVRKFGHSVIFEETRLPDFNVDNGRQLGIGWGIFSMRDEKQSRISRIFESILIRDQMKAKLGNVNFDKVVWTQK